MELTYRFEFYGKETGNYYGSMLELPDMSEHEMALLVNEFYDRARAHLKMFYGLEEMLRVEYIPDPVHLVPVQVDT